jgi:dUTP pyrophosphatase
LLGRHLFREIFILRIHFSKSNMKVKKVTKDAIIPTRATVGSVGYDLYCDHDFRINPWSREMVSTGIAIQIPEGYYGRIAPRSGLTHRNGIDVGAGILDNDFRGIVNVILFNHSDFIFEAKHGARIAQLIIIKISTPEIEVVEELTETERGEGGFGSTGK